MRIIHVKSTGTLAETARRKLERFFYPDVKAAMANVKVYFPYHVVSSSNGYLRVTNKDRSIMVALFKADLD